jgi:UDP-glucuronate decarboxylase
MENGRIIVAGGAGFVGSHLCERLLREGHSVMALDDFTTGSPKNVAHLTRDARFRLEVHDVTQPFSFAASRIYNLACPASPPHYQRDPVRTTLISVLGTLNCLLLAQKHGARFFQASTSEVYGDPEVHPQPESYRGAVNPIGIRACYDEGKRCAESLTMDFNRAHGVEVRLARIFNTYGPRMAFDDLVDGIIRLMEHPEERGPVNLGNPCEFTMLELAEEILSLTGSRSRIVHMPLPEDDPKQRKPVIDRAKQVLGFRPRVSLRDGLGRTIADFRARMDTLPRMSSAGLVASR